MDIFEALRVAIRSEIAAQKMYTRLSEQTDDPEAKSLFSFLSRYETMHQQFLEAERKAKMSGNKDSHGKPSYWLKILDEEINGISQEEGSPEKIMSGKRLSIMAAEKVAEILKNANDELQKKQVRYEQELSIAADIQRKLLPQEFPQNIDLQISGSNIMASSVGGDYFDFIVNKPGQLSIVMADSMGKGIPAALLMTTVRAIWRSYSASTETRWPDRALEAINRIVYPDLRAAEAFVTMFDMVYDPASSIIRYSSAGHNPPILKTALSQECRKLELGGPPLGVLPDPNFPVGEVPLSEGDFLVIYTDGVVEATNKNNELFGIDRLCNILEQKGGSSSEDIKNLILSEIDSFTDKSPQRDDITILVLRKI